MLEKFKNLPKGKRNSCIIIASILIAALVIVIIICSVKGSKHNSDVDNTTTGTTAPETTTEAAQPAETTEAIETTNPETTAATVKPKVKTTAEVTTAKPNPKPTNAPDSDNKPVITLTQTFPSKFTFYGAEFEITSAKIDYVKSDGEFYITAHVKRCDDGLDGEKNGIFRVLVKDAQGNVILRSSMGAGGLKIGEEGKGGCTFSVGDHTGPFTVELVSQ